MGHAPSRRRCWRSLALLRRTPQASAWTWPLGEMCSARTRSGPMPTRPASIAGSTSPGRPGSPFAPRLSGTVSFAGVVPSSGRTVTIQTDGYAVSLTHLGEITVAKGAAVAEGESVGIAGHRAARPSGRRPTSTSASGSRRQPTATSTRPRSCRHGTCAAASACRCGVPSSLPTPRLRSWLRSRARRRLRWPPPLPEASPELAVRCGERRARLRPQLPRALGPGRNGAGVPLVDDRGGTAASRLGRRPVRPAPGGGHQRARGQSCREARSGVRARARRARRRARATLLAAVASPTGPRPGARRDVDRAPAVRAAGSVGSDRLRPTTDPVRLGPATALPAARSASLRDGMPAAARRRRRTCRSGPAAAPAGDASRRRVGSRRLAAAGGALRGRPLPSVAAARLHDRRAGPACCALGSLRASLSSSPGRSARGWLLARLRRINGNGALLRHDADLLRQLDPAHRACLHDDRGGHPGPPPASAWRRDVLPDRGRRARREGGPRRGGAGLVAAGVRRPDRGRLA